MHDALWIEEVFLCIVEALNPGTLGARSTLSALARTCKTFHEPAIDALWYTQTSLGPILRLVPGLEVSINRWPNEGFEPPTLQEILDGPTIRMGSTEFGSDDLRPFDKYAAKIKQIHGKHIGLEPFCYTIDYRVLVALHAARPVVCFPQLRYLQWPLQGVVGSDQYDNEPIISMFFGQNLSKLELDIGTNISSTTQKALKEACPALESFSFSFESISIPDRLNLFQGWASLKSLAYSGLWSHPYTLIIPTLLPNLETINLSIDDIRIKTLEKQEGLRLDMKVPHIYASLRRFNLIVGVGMNPRLDALFSRLSCPLLEFLGIRLMGGNFIEQFTTPSFRTISRMCSPRALQTLKITMNATISKYEHPVLPFDVIRPLLSFPNIHTFHSNLCFSDFDDTKILQISQAWRYLVSLRLKPNQAERPAMDYITLKALGHLSKNCPNLEELCAIVDARSIPELASLTPDNLETNKSVEQRKLVSLSFVDSSINDPESVASYLFSLFPSLFYVSSTSMSQEYHGKTQEDWKEVGGHVGELRKRRQRSRR